MEQNSLKLKSEYREEPQRTGRIVSVHDRCYEY